MDDYIDRIYLVQDEQTQLDIEVFEAFSKQGEIQLPLKLVKPLGAAAMDSVDKDDNPTVYGNFSPKEVYGKNDHKKGLVEVFKGRCKIEDEPERISVLEISPNSGLPAEFQLFKEDAF